MTDPERQPAPQPLDYAPPRQRRRGLDLDALDRIGAAIGVVLIVLIVLSFMWLFRLN